MLWGVSRLMDANQTGFNWAFSLWAIFVVNPGFS